MMLDGPTVHQASASDKAREFVASMEDGELVKYHDAPDWQRVEWVRKALGYDATHGLVHAVTDALLDQIVSLVDDGELYLPGSETETDE